MFESWWYVYVVCLNGEGDMLYTCLNETVLDIIDTHMLYVWKVTDDMKTHKNPGLRATDAPVPGKPAPNPKGGASPAKSQAVAVKPSRCVLDGKKWVVEYYTGNKGIVISETEMKQTVYIYKCIDCTIQIKGKVRCSGLCLLTFLDNSFVTFEKKNYLT